MTPAELDQGLASYSAHLTDLAQTFNACARSAGVPVSMCPKNAIEAVNVGVGLARITPFWSRTDDSGIVHQTQLKTAVDCLAQLSENPKRCGHVVGAMQSGKTTTSLAMQWAGPALYALTGVPVYPFYLLGNQTNHEDQTRRELDRFLAYYGNLEIKAEAPQGHGLNGVFARSPSLSNYRGQVLRGAFEDTFTIPQLQDLVHRRVGGEQSVAKIADLCRRATEQGYRPLMMIDEPQFGASDRIVVDEDGRNRRPCVLVQIFNRIEKEIGSTTRKDHWFVGLSATPFELNDLEQVWEVRQELTEAYSGFNFFNGRPLAENVDVTPPTTMGLTQFAGVTGIPFLANVSLAAYDGSGKRFTRHARKVGFDGDQSQYQDRVVEALRGVVSYVIDRRKEGIEPVGLCIRAFNHNAKTEALIARLALDPSRVEVIQYFGPQAAGYSVKRMIAKRRRNDLPFVIFVTNRARMADAFPVQVRFFMDLAQKASDLNALLQGLLGRACGYNKKSEVVLSDDNAAIVEAYVATNGGYVHKTSRHSIAVGGYRRGAPTGMIKLRREMDDAQVAEFFARVNAEIVEEMVKQGSEKLVVKRSRGGPRRGPVLTIADELGLFDHIERAQVRATLYPEIPTGFKVARSRDMVVHSRDPGVRLGYDLDDAGNCRYTFRWSDRDAAAQGGAAGRAKGQKDTGQWVEPTIYVEKYDPETRKVIDRDDEQALGSWRAFMVTFPLVAPVRETWPAQVAYPVVESPYSEWMSEREQRVRAGDQARRESVRSSRPGARSR